MNAETDLNQLLTSLSPTLNGERFVFCCVPQQQVTVEQLAQATGIFKEAEGVTLILSQHSAEWLQLEYQGLFHCITLQVHSSLQAVGLTAAVAEALSAKGISANVIAAYHHDHIFIPDGRAAEALEILNALSNKPTG